LIIFVFAVLAAIHSTLAMRISPAVAILLWIIVQSPKRATSAKEAGWLGVYCAHGELSLRQRVFPE
jgi:hypothetical protein